MHAICSAGDWRGGKYDFSLFLFRFQKQTNFGVSVIAG
jgi:hypothetical protein